MKYRDVFETSFVDLCKGPSLQKGNRLMEFSTPVFYQTPPTRAFWLREQLCLLFFFVFFFFNLGELSPLHCCGDSINETDRWGHVWGGDCSWLPSYLCDPSLQKPALMPWRLSKTDIQQWQFGHLNMTLDVPKTTAEAMPAFSVVYHRGRITVLEIGCVQSISVSANEHLWPCTHSAV